MLAEPTVMRLLDPGGVNRTVEANYRIYAAVWTDGSLPRLALITVAPISDSGRRELGEAVVTNSDFACEELLTMPGRVAGSAHGP